MAEHEFTGRAGDGIPVQIRYRNWRGEERIREVIPLELWYGNTDQHPVPQYLVKCLDLEDGSVKDFSLLGFRGQ